MKTSYYGLIPSLPKLGLPLLALVLSGCMSDSASYLVDGDKNHTITVLRNQDYFWKDSVNVSVVPTRMPECQGSIKIKDVPRQANMRLYWSPDDYAEPMYILEVEGDYYAASTLSCRAQRFDETPADPGQPVGAFQEQDGRLVFLPQNATPANPG